jgi:hypothetical protein
LLVLYFDRSLNGGTYSILSPLILTTGSRSNLISAIESDYWIVDHREQLLEALGDLRGDAQGRTASTTLKEGGPAFGLAPIHQTAA